MAAKVRKVFPGGNTALGFYSYYDYIIPEDARRIFVIKGGPGVGKSSFMKKIAQEMLEKGFDVELHQCSSDNDSLDGVVIPELDVAFIDGTAPHVVDPKNPGCVDEILHLGDYWDVEVMERNKEYILKDNKEVGRLFDRAYRYLAAAKEVMDDLESKYGEAMDFGKVNLITEELKEEIFKGLPVSAIPGKERHLFGSAYTPGGFVDFADTVLDKVEKVYYISGQPGTGKTTMMNRIARYALDRGLSVEYFHGPLKPDKLDSIVIGQLNTAVTCSDKGKDFASRKIDLNSYLNQDILAEEKEFIQRDWKIYYRLIDEAISTIARAKKVHDHMETFYIPNMDFARIDALRERTIERVLGYSKKD